MTDNYRRSHDGLVIGHTLLEAGRYAESVGYLRSIMLDMGGNEPQENWIDVTADVWDELDKQSEDAKDEITVLREALADLKSYVDRELLKLRIEVSLKLEGRED